MKVLIYAGCLLVGTILNMILGNVTGYRAGALLLYVIIVFVANWLCKKWDERNS